MVPRKAVINTGKVIKTGGGLTAGTILVLAQFPCTTAS